MKYIIIPLWKIIGTVGAAVLIISFAAITILLYIIWHSRPPDKERIIKFFEHSEEEYEHNWGYYYRTYPTIFHYIWRKT